MSPYDKNENERAWTAWQCLTRTNANIFLTGKAGTGKTTFLKNLQKSGVKQMIIVAPTGVAAINAGGVTIHSFFQLPLGIITPDQSLQETSKKIRKEKIRIIRRMDLLVIDEISMVRADLLDAIDVRLRQIRRNSLPFGGVQLLLIGDLLQLAPVVKDEETEILRQFYNTNYFFSSHALARTQLFSVELKNIYRQTDSKFIDLLNKVRNNTLDRQSLDFLNSHYAPTFNPPDSDHYIRLTTHNAQAESINSLKIAQISSKAYTYSCTIKGTFPETSYPTEKSLILKKGAQVMFLRNDREEERRYYNGKIGRIVSLNSDSVTVSCDDKFGNIEVKPDEWENTTYEVDETTGEIKSKVVGTFLQIPLCLAWAITIHKSQGLTFDRAIIDAGKSFSPGQVYVALSRCRTFEGLVLSSTITPQSIITDPTVNTFMAEQEKLYPSSDTINDIADNYAITVMEELLDFRPVTTYAHRILRLLEENYLTTYPRIIRSMTERLQRAELEINVTARKFITLCRNERAKGISLLSDKGLNTRATNGAKYFEQKVTEILDALKDETNISLDNKENKKRLNEDRALMEEGLAIKHAELKAVAAQGFSPEVVMKAKATVSEPSTNNTSGEKKDTPSSEDAEVANIELFKALKHWRYQRSAELGIEPYMVANNKSLIAVANMVPRNETALKAIPGLGVKKVKAYGKEILQIVAKYINTGTHSSVSDAETEEGR